MDIKADMIGEIFEQSYVRHGEVQDVTIYIVKYCGDDLCFHNIEYREDDGTWHKVDVHGGGYINDDIGSRYIVVNHGFKQIWD